MLCGGVSLCAETAEKPYFKRFSGIEKAHRNSIKITVDLWRNRMPCFIPGIIDTLLGIFIIIQYIISNSITVCPILSFRFLYCGLVSLPIKLYNLIIFHHKLSSLVSEKYSSYNKTLFFQKPYTFFKFFLKILFFCFYYKIKHCKLQCFKITICIFGYLISHWH